MRSSLVIVATLFLATTAPAQKVWIVDEKGGPGIWKDTLGLMVHVRDGDLILVRAGSYSGLSITDKSVTVVRDPRTGPVDLGGFTVNRLSAGKNVTIRGVKLRFWSISMCKGSIVMDRCETRTIVQTLSVHDSHAVTFTNSTFHGPRRRVHVSVSHATLQVHGCAFHGGLAGDCVIVGPYSRVIASESTFLGGNGIPGTVMHGICYVGPSPGGSALRLEKGRAELTGCTVKGGAGVGAVPPCPGAAAGAAVKNNGGTLVQVPRAARSFRANSPVREGERLTIEIGGRPGDHAFLLYNLAHGSLEAPGCGAALFPTLPGIAMLYAGVVRTNALKVEVIVQPMAATTKFTTLAAQALLLPKTGCVLTPPATIVLLDKGY